MERRNINHDQIYETLRELAQTSLNGNWESLVGTEKFEKLKAGKQEQLSVHSILMPSVLDGFKSVTIVSGKLHRLNGLSWLWSGTVDFREDRALMSSLQCG
jgi:hypothetical protein